MGTASEWRFFQNGEDIAYRPRPVWSCNTGNAVLEAALEGMGICQLPKHYLDDALQSRRLVPVLEEFLPRDMPIWAVYPDKRHLSPKVERFISVLKTNLPVAMAEAD